MKRTVTVKRTWRGLPSMIRGSYFHCWTASTAAWSRMGMDRRILVSTTLPCLSVLASMMTVP